MDNRAIIGIILIFLVTMVFTTLQKNELERQAAVQQAKQDSLAALMPADSIPPAPVQQQAPATAVTETPPALTGQIESSTLPPQNRQQSGIPSDSLEKKIRINNGVVNAILTNRRGGNFDKWQLNHYKTYTKGAPTGNVDLSRSDSLFTHLKNGFTVELIDKKGDKIDLSQYTVFTKRNDGDEIILSESDSVARVEYYLPIGQGRIVKQFVFRYNSYATEVNVRFENLQGALGRGYSVRWENGLWTTEENRQDDYSYARAFAFLGGEDIDISVDDTEVVSDQKSGRIEWTAIRTKYFLMAIIPKKPENLIVRLEGEGIGEDERFSKIYSTTLDVDLPYTLGSTYQDSYQVYLGPLDYKILSAYEADLEELVMNNGWYEGLFRWITILILPILGMLYSFIPNYGWVIIIFGVLVKILLHPLTKKSYESMSRMQELSPKMTEIREKYKSDPQRQQQETMKLYKSEGINPLGGCIPTLLQMPLLFALFILFRSTIQLRGEPFILWIKDLSAADALQLPFTLPVLGDTINILPILMSLTMIWQSRLTITDQKQKFMIYMMPAMLLFIFYQLPSGLNLYYSVFNVLSMFQTRAIKKRIATGNDKPGAAVASQKRNERPGKNGGPQKRGKSKAKPRKPLRR